MTLPDDDTRFDAALRAHYREASARLPGPLQLALTPAVAAQRRAAASASTHRWRWPALAAFASLALVIGLMRLPGDAPNAAAPPASIVQTAPETPSAPVAEDDGSELLTRNPDFYAWLGSEEARRLAME